MLLRTPPALHFAARLLGLLLWLGTPGTWAAPGPTAPCDGLPHPAWPGSTGQLHIGIHREAQLPSPWQPPACGDWQPAAFSVLLAASGRLQLPGGSDALLARLGAVSTLTGLRYWSVSRDRWTTLIEQAHALSGPDPERRRADFTAGELETGTDYYYWQQEPTTSGSAVYRFRLLEHTAERLLVSVHNASPARRFGITMLDAGAAETLYLFVALGDDVWGYYQLTRLGHGLHDWLGVTDASYANRASAVFRHFAGLSEDSLPVWKD